MTDDLHTERADADYLPRTAERLRVLVSPFARSAGGNPFLDLMTEALERNGVTCVDFNRRLAIRGDVDVVHVHWPEQLVRWQSPAPVVARDLAAALTALSLAKSRGARLVWTAHNTQPHDIARPRLYAAFFRLFIRLVDMVVVLSPSSIDHVRSAHPGLAKTPFEVVPHGHYRDRYPAPTSRTAARERFGLSADAPVLLTLGMIRRYKGIELLVDEFVTSGTTGMMLVAGEVRDAGLRDDLTRAAGSGERVRLMLERVSETDVSRLHAAADVVVLPYAAASVLNSGATLLGLSLGVPVVAPRTPAMRDLQRIVGEEWLGLFSGGPRDALDAAQTLLSRPRSTEPDLESLNWDVLGVRCFDAYRALMPDRTRRA